MEKNRIFEHFNKDLKELTLYCDASLEGNRIVILLDNNPDEETKIIIKLARTKYKYLLRKIPSDDDRIVYNIISEEDDKKIYISEDTRDKLQNKINRLNERIKHAEENPTSDNIYKIEKWETKIEVCEEILKDSVIIK